MKKAMLFLFALVVAMGTNVQAQSLKKLYPADDEYDLVTHKVLNATGIICDIVSEGSFSIDGIICDIVSEGSFSIDGIVFDWADLGSTLSVDSDREGLIYNINGNIIVGKTIADFPAGFVVEKYRSLTGAVLVPWE